MLSNNLTYAGTIIAPAPPRHKTKEHRLFLEDLELHAEFFAVPTRDLAGGPATAGATRAIASRSPWDLDPFFRI